VHPDHGLIATITKGVSDFVKGGGLMGKPAPKPATTAPTGPVKAAAKPTGKITITGKTLPGKPSVGANKPDLRVVGGSGTKGWNF